MLLKALDYYEQALKIQNELDDKNSVAWINGNMGLLYNDLGKYDLAIGYIQKCLEIPEAINDKTSQATAFGNLSKIFCNQMKFKEALD